MAARVAHTSRPCRKPSFPLPVDRDERSRERRPGFRRGLHAAPALSVDGEPAFAETSIGAGRKLTTRSERLATCIAIICCITYKHPYVPGGHRASSPWPSRLLSLSRERKPGPAHAPISNMNRCFAMSANASRKTACAGRAGPDRHHRRDPRGDHGDDRGDGFLEPIELDRALSERRAGDLHRPVRQDRRLGRRWSPPSATTISAGSMSSGCAPTAPMSRPSRSAPTIRPAAPSCATATTARAISSTTSANPPPRWSA